MRSVSSLWRTRITDLLGIDYPIIQGALARVGTADLAVAVSEAGGLGTITANALRTPERLQREICRVKAMTRKPFAVNLSPPLQEWRDVAIEEKVPIIETAGLPSGEHGKHIKNAGLIWIHKATTVKHAVAAARDGADAVCIVGLEGAGFKNPATLTTLVAVPMVARQVKVPVIAAGGIGDARGFLAALALGAEGLQMGTAFCAVEECPFSLRRKQSLIEADPSDLQWRDPILNVPREEEIQAVIEKLAENADISEVFREARTAENLQKDESGTMIYPASSAVGFIDRIMTTKELIDNIIAEAEAILQSGLFQIEKTECS